MKIRSKLILLQILMVCPVLFIMLAFHYLSQKLESDFDAMVYRTIPTLQSLEAIRSKAIGIFASANRIALIKYLYKNTGLSDQENDLFPNGLYLSHEIEELNEGIDATYKLLKEYEHLVHQFFPLEREFAQKVRFYIEKMVEDIRKIIHIKPVQENIEIIKELEYAIEQDKHQFDAIIDRAIDQELSEVEEHHEDLEESIVIIEFRSFITGMVLLIIGLILGHSLSRSIVRPIERLSQLTKNPHTSLVTVQSPPGRGGQKNPLDLFLNVFSHSPSGGSERLASLGNFNILPESGNEIEELTSSFMQMLDNQNEAREKLVNTAKFQEVLLDAIPSPIFFMDTGGYYLGCNNSMFKFFET